MLLAILKQVGIGSLDNKKLGEDLGISDKNLLKGRLFRFRAKIAKLNGEASSTSSSPTKTPTTPKGGRKSKAATSKKRKLETSDEEDDLLIKDEDIDSRSGVGELNESFFETPTRTMPGRKARATSFKEEENEPEEIDDEFQDSGHGGTGTDASEQSARASTSDEEI